MSRDHGGGVDAARARHGGTRADWLDLSTGINPVPYPVGQLSGGAWTDLPDRAANGDFVAAARSFWRVPDGATVLPVPGASAPIARIPMLFGPGRVAIPGPTYNEHAAAFRACGWTVAEAEDGPAEARVLVHPNNPDGRLWPEPPAGPGPTIIDESFCDVAPDRSHVARTGAPGTIVLKSFGKFWGLAGLRLGCVIAHPDTLAPPGRASLADMLGPWAVSGPALEIGARALRDRAWAERTRARLVRDAARLDAAATGAGARLVGGTSLFRLYEVAEAARWHDGLAEERILTRVFPWSTRHLRLGLPAPADFPRFEAALARLREGGRGDGAAERRPPSPGPGR